MRTEYRATRTSTVATLDSEDLPRAVDSHETRSSMSPVVTRPAFTTSCPVDGTERRCGGFHSVPVRDAVHRLHVPLPDSSTASIGAHGSNATGDDDGMRIVEVQIEHFRGFDERVCWQPGRQAVLLGPNNAGKTTLLRAVDLVLNAHRDAYRDRLAEWDYPERNTKKPVSISVVLGDLSPEDLDHFEPYIEGRHRDGRFGDWSSPKGEFDIGEVVLRLRFEGIYGDPSRAVYARPETRNAPVRQADKIRIGWTYIAAGADPGHELAFYGNSTLSRLFEQADLSAPLNGIRNAIEGAKGPLLAEPQVAEARDRLQSAAHRLGLAPSGDALDLVVAGLSDRRVLQSLELVLQGTRSDAHLPLGMHGRGTSRVLLLAAMLQRARRADGNLILAVEEPEQNLEPVKQRLVARSLLLTEDSGANQVILTTHAPAIAGVVPLRDIQLIRETAPPIRPLSQALRPEHQFYERHATGALSAGFYARAVLLVEGPTERGALPALWAKLRPGDGLDEHRIEIIDCESIDNIPSFARFFASVGIPVAVVCDDDKPDVWTKILAENPNLAMKWGSHTDWEGVLANESDPSELASAMERCRALWQSWEHHGAHIVGSLRSKVGDSEHLANATDLGSAVLGYDEPTQRTALHALLGGKCHVSFKTAMSAREIAEALTTVPPTVATMIERVHAWTAGTASADGILEL